MATPSATIPMTMMCLTMIRGVQAGFGPVCAANSTRPVTVNRAIELTIHGRARRSIPATARPGSTDPPAESQGRTTRESVA